MTDSVAALASSMRADAEALRAISQNVANAQTPAYRREIALAYSTFDATAATTEAAARANNVLSLASAVDLRPGTLQSTGEPMNLAVEGPGFFVVSTAEGERLTRRGDFRVDSQGNLATVAGDAVIGVSGGPIRIGSARPTIASDGAVRVDGAVVDRIRLVEVADAKALQAAGNGLYRLADGAEPLDTQSSQVRQGFLETSNVQSVDEMIALMETMRRFEAAQRFIRGYDTMVDNAISTLGKV